ncbi:MAG: hypothetical protein WD875_04795 [Pirellulales bacterium]
MSNLRVVKLGGSLLDLTHWPQRLVVWLASQPTTPTVLIVGGGVLADAIRRYDRQFELGEEAAHWLSIGAMSLQAEMAATVLPRRLAGVTLVDRFDDLFAVAANEVAVFDPEPFLRDSEAGFAGTPLPHGWHITSDSIAARVAECLDAAELVLLKSAPPPEHPTDPAAGYVDEHFPIAARGLRSVRYIDLRGELAAT